MPTTAAAISPAKSRKAIYAACIGNLLEWYDFGVYAYLATLIAAKFFPSTDPTVGLLAAFAAYGVGFLARPLGGVIIGRMGDTRGRKVALVLTIFMMSVGTIGIGLLPTYESIGVWAAVLLTALRIVQGIAAGGEWGTSTAFIVEWATPRRRGFMGSFQQVSTAGGSLLGSATAALLTSMLSKEQMLDWGWRIPFIMGAVLLAVGIYIRRNVEESPSYEAAKTKVNTEPAVAGWRLGAQAFGFTIFWTVAYYTLLAWMPSFTQHFTGLTPSQALWANTLGLVATVVAIPFWGALSDRVGRRPVLLGATVLIGVTIYPLLSLMMRHGGLEVVIACQIALGVMLAMYSGAGPAAISEIFPTHQRSTWMSAGYTLAAAVFGGFAPFMATWLIRSTGSPLSPTYLYLIPAAVVSAVVVLRLKETAGADLQ
jgi:MHS family proline/betaine transporter-like MFS transporter